MTQESVFVLSVRTTAPGDDDIPDWQVFRVAEDEGLIASALMEFLASHTQAEVKVEEMDVITRDRPGPRA